MKIDYETYKSIILHNLSNICYILFTVFGCMHFLYLYVELLPLCNLFVTVLTFFIKRYIILDRTLKNAVNFNKKNGAANVKKISRSGVRHCCNNLNGN